MALTQTQTLPAPFLEDISKDYAKRLGQVTAPALDTSQFAPTVEPQDPYQTEAYGRVPGAIRSSLHEILIYSCTCCPYS